MLEIAETKEDLPKNTDLQCPICLDDINLDELDKFGTPNCVICDNGHRIHNACYRQANDRVCPVCKNDHMNFCKTSRGYLYAPRKGGKKRRTKRRTKRQTKRHTRRHRRKTI